MKNKTEPAIEEVEVFVEGLGDAELKELNRIKSKDVGELLHPKAILEAAKHKDNPLHERFEWDNSIAGEQYRLAQARALIRCVRVIYPDRQPVRYFPHVRSEKKGYRQYTEVLQVDALRKSYLHQFARDVEGLVDKYQNFAELSGDLRPITSLLKRLQQKLGKDKKAAA